MPVLPASAELCELAGDRAGNSSHVRNSQLSQTQPKLSAEPSQVSRSQHTEVDTTDQAHKKRLEAAIVVEVILDTYPHSFREVYISEKSKGIPSGSKNVVTVCVNSKA